MEMSKEYKVGYERYINKSFVRYRNTKANIMYYLSSVTDDTAMKLDIINHCVVDYLTKSGLYAITAENQDTAKIMVVVSYFSNNEYHIEFCEYAKVSEFVNSIVTSESVAVSSTLKTLMLGVVPGTMPINVFSRAEYKRDSIRTNAASTTLEEFFRNEETYTLILI